MAMSSTSSPLLMDRSYSALKAASSSTMRCGYEARASHSSSLDEGRQVMMEVESHHGLGGAPASRNPSYSPSKPLHSLDGPVATRTLSNQPSPSPSCTSSPSLHPEPSGNDRYIYFIRSSLLNEVGDQSLQLPASSSMSKKKRTREVEPESEDIVNEMKKNRSRIDDRSNDSPTTNNSMDHIETTTIKQDSIATTTIASTMSSSTTSTTSNSNHFLSASLPAIPASMDDASWCAYFVPLRHVLDSQFGRVYLCAVSCYAQTCLPLDYPPMSHVIVKESEKQRMAHFGGYTADSVKRESAILKLLWSSISFRAHPLSKCFYRFIAEVENDRHHRLVSSYAGRGDLLSLVVPPSGQGMLVDEKSAMIIFRQLIESIQLLHSMGIAHGDLSLENICLQDDGNISIIDLGAAVVHPYSPLLQCDASHPLYSVAQSLRDSNYHCTPVLHHQDGHNRNRFLVKPIPSAARPGKRNYISPELRNASSANGRCYDLLANDVWGIGVSIYAAVTAKFPYAQASSKDEHFCALLSGQWARSERERNMMVSSAASMHYHSMATKPASNVNMNAGMDTTITAAAPSHHNPPTKPQRPPMSMELIELLDSIFKPADKRPTLSQLLDMPFFRTVKA